MTRTELRDHFAGQAMIALMSFYGGLNARTKKAAPSAQSLAWESYAVADEMLKARDPQPAER